MSETVQIANAKLQTVLVALRELGKSTVPMALAVRMVKTQKAITDHLQAVSEVNNALIEKYGETQENGQTHVTPEMEWWDKFVEAANTLNMVEFDLGAPFDLYEQIREEAGTNEIKAVYGWTPDVKTPVAITPNIMADADALLVVHPFDAPEEAKIIGHIEPVEEIE